MNVFRLLLVSCLCISLSACGVGKFFVKRSVLSLEQDIASEFKSYAKFSKDQKGNIDTIASLSADWIRSNQLILLQQALQNIAADIEKNGTLEEQNWGALMNFLSDPLALESAPQVLDSVATLAFSMNTTQSQSAVKKLTKEHKKRERKRNKETPDDQLDSIMSAIKTVFKELDIARSKEQLLAARKILSQRRNNSGLYTELSRKRLESVTTLLAAPRNSKQEFNTAFKQAWQTVNASSRTSKPEDWQYNVKLSYSAINALLVDLNQPQRNKAASKVREYADLFLELSKLEQL